MKSNTLYTYISCLYGFKLLRSPIINRKLIVDTPLVKLSPPVTNQYWDRRVK